MKLKDGACKIVGNNHLKFTVTDADEIISFEAIAFDFGGYCKDLRSALSFDLCYSIEENVFNGRTTMQFKVKDIKVNVLDTVSNEN